MTLRQALVLILICLVIALAAPLVSYADEPCQSPEQVSQLVTTDGGMVVGAAYYRGSTTDEMLVVETREAIIIYGFKDGCLVAAVALEPRSVGTPA